MRVVLQCACVCTCVRDQVKMQQAVKLKIHTPHPHSPSTLLIAEAGNPLYKLIQYPSRYHFPNILAAAGINFSLMCAVGGPSCHDSCTHVP